VTDHLPAAPRPPAAPSFAAVLRRVDAVVGRGLARVTGGTVAPYQAAVVRIGFALTWLLFLLREWPHRSRLYGPESPWSYDIAHRLIATNHAFTVLMWSGGRAWFEVVYAAAIVSSVLLLLGWRTRTSALLFMVGVLSLQNRSVFDGDGGDNVIHLMALYLVFTRCGRVWSLDAHRAGRSAARAAAAGTPERAGGGADATGVVLWSLLGVVLLTVLALGDLDPLWACGFCAALVFHAVRWALDRWAPGEPRTVLEMVSNLVHAGAMLVIVVEVCFIYACAGWYKIQGSRWEDGTALYYPLHLNDFTPWPAFSHLLASNGVIVMLITYGTVIVQVAFPFTLFNRRVKNVLLVMMMCEHAGIAVTLGLPFFSLAMISADAVFLPTGFLRWTGAALARAVNGGVRRVTKGPGGGAAADLPGQRPAGDPAASTLLG